MASLFTLDTFIGIIAPFYDFFLGIVNVVNLPFVNILNFDISWVNPFVDNTVRNLSFHINDIPILNFLYDVFNNLISFITDVNEPFWVVILKLAPIIMLIFIVFSVFKVKE